MVAGHKFVKMAKRHEALVVAVSSSKPEEAAPPAARDSRLRVDRREKESLDFRERKVSRVVPPTARDHMNYVCCTPLL